MKFEKVTFEIFHNFCFAFHVIKILHKLEIYPIVKFDEKKIYFYIKLNLLNEQQRLALNDLIEKLDLENVLYY
jgi:hypothetical protein